MQRVQIRPFQRQALIIIKQPAVKPGNPFQAKAPALLHRPEQIAGQPGKVGGRPPRFPQQLAKQPLRQQPDVLGEQAEQQPGHKMRHRLRRMAALA